MKTTNQYHCSLEFHLSALYYEAHCRTCPRTSIVLGQHDTALDDSLHRQYTWVCIRHLKGEHLMPVIGLCPRGSELAYFLQEILFLWMVIPERTKHVLYGLYYKGPNHLDVIASSC